MATVLARPPPAVAPTPPSARTIAVVFEGCACRAAFAGVRAFRSRQACATLPFRALLAALAPPG